VNILASCCRVTTTPGYTTYTYRECLPRLGLLALPIQVHKAKGKTESSRGLYAPRQWASRVQSSCNWRGLPDWDGGQFRPAKKSSGCKMSMESPHEPHERRWPVVDGWHGSSGNSPAINIDRDSNKLGASSSSKRSTPVANNV
jgi:hypothetical protein